jgi:hypothetical protein
MVRQESMAALGFKTSAMDLATQNTELDIKAQVYCA